MHYVNSKEYLLEETDINRDTTLFYQAVKKIKITSNTHKQAMKLNKETEVRRSNQTIELVNALSAKNVIGCRWAFTLINIR